MKQEIENFLATAGDKKTLDKAELKRLYVAIGNDQPKCESDTCIHKMLTAVKKYYHLNFVAVSKAKERKHTLIPGNHAFAPGGPAVHNNDNTTDKQIDFYLKAFPHIEKLLVTQSK